MIARATKAAPMVVLTLVSLTTQGAPAQTFTTLYQFTGGRDGGVPLAPLTLDDEGNLYGTTFGGGDMRCIPNQGCGTVFKINTARKETVLHRFHGRDGVVPAAGLIRDSVGNLYGTTFGTVFMVTPTGRLTVLYSFSGGRDGYGGRDGWEPWDARLVRDSAGNLYGTTVVGGDLSCHVYKYNGCGVVFKVDTLGKFTVLHRFHGRDGADPSGGLILDAEGNLYGTTNGGTSKDGDTASNCGTVFKLDKNGKLTVLHRFEAPGDGCFVRGSLIRDAEGNLYGNTQLGGGASNGGTIFKIDKTGKETILYAFTGAADGAEPRGSLISDGAGNFYGTTSYGGDLGCHAGPGLGCGTIFKLDANATQTVLHTFGRGPGKFPFAGLVMDGSGTLYGTTSGNDRNDSGTVFKLVP